MTASGWTGQEPFKDKKRVVNFNYSQDKHVVDQPARYVTVNPSKNPFQPSEMIEWRNSLGTGVTAEPIARRTEGCTYFDDTAPAAGMRFRPESQPPTCNRRRSH